MCSSWEISIYVYGTLALLSFIPTLHALLKKVKLNPGGESFEKSPHFNEVNKLKLIQHYTRIQGTLVFWKNQAARYRRFHYYSLFWTLSISILIPIISQSVNGSFESKLFITIISTHVALLAGFHRGLKVENNFKAFRNGESEFYDIYRRMLDIPKSFGKTEDEQVDKYFKDVEMIRKAVRISETDNFPIIEETKPKT